MPIRWRRAIAIYEILTFALTAWYVVRVLSKASARVPAVYIVCALALAGAGVSLIAGLWLWRGDRRGRGLSLFMQAMQLPHIIVPGFVGYSLALGLSPVIGFGPKPLMVTAAVHLLVVSGRDMKGAYLVLSGGGSSDGLYFGVNILALAACAVLIRSTAPCLNARSNDLIKQ